jgi:hypothetical protein
VTTTGERARDEATVAWVREHRDALLIAGAGVGFLVLWMSSLSWLGMLLLLGFVAAFELVVYRIGAEPAPS